VSDEPSGVRALRDAADALRRSRRLVVLTGAGVSRESGIPTFRDALDGLWARYDPTELATPRAFHRNPRLVWDWYEHRRGLLAQAAPNPGHFALAALERLLPQVVVVTQNVDGLHAAAGSTDVIAVHGDIRRSRCSAGCRGEPTYADVDALPAWDRAAGPPRCPHCGAYLRPDVVWFEENLPAAALERAVTLSERADVLLVVGTSGVVQPIASLPALAHRQGATVIEVNPDATPITPLARWRLAGPSGEILPRLTAEVERLAAEAGDA